MSDLMDRFDDTDDSPDSSGSTDNTRGSSSTNDTQDTDRTRDRSKYVLYVSDELQEELDDRFEKFNARRSLNDQERVEKHKHFLEGVIRSGLDADYEENVLREFDRRD